MQLNDHYQNRTFNPFDSLPIMVTLCVALMTVLVLHYHPFFG